ncbi:MULTISPECIES: maleate cis-trans isomerase family protein [Roseomonadaceae]|uniref:Aspartate/glutamate racemase family protein n=1 Tax=Falsiroseomonas oleicola TaxID=2801474 RepID=A0ABS6H9Q6_9PROT|nr:aspartate/glutamate racemase family protein [Roseomonas oleicola]MBU8545400.1 aspartate/glutamate racemase family protein [Roseomonas oleicola]
MKAVADYRPYGWRGKIGLIVPSTNTINEPEFWRLAPKGVTIHTARATLLGKMTEDSYIRMAEAVKQAADDLATAEVDVVAYGCTSGSFVCSLQDIVADLHQRTGVPAIATSGSVVAALRALGVKRVAVATPYVDFVNEAERRFLADYGFEVTSLHGLGMGETQEERRGIGRVPPEHLYRMARACDRPEAEAIFLSCTNVPTFDVIAQIEADLGKPVVTSNQSCFWACLRMLGLPDRIEGHGRLLSDCVAPIGMDSFALPKSVRAA